MSFLRIKQHPVQHPLLKPLVKYFWVAEIDRIDVCINHKLLPVGNVDMVAYTSSPMTYTLNGACEVTVKGVHISGIREQHCFLHQAGPMEMLGIAFFPAGVYPFVNMPLSELTNATIELNDVFHEFTERVEERVYIKRHITEKLQALEQELVRLLDMESLLPKEIAQVLQTFSSLDDAISIRQFCDQYGIHSRTLERQFQKYVGVRPKFFQRLSRFQQAVKHLVGNERYRLTSVAYEHDYYDQSHFIKEFSHFAGCSPSQFLAERRSVKEIITYL